MNRILFFDTETSGLPDDSLPLGDDYQPHIVQLAAIVADEDTRKVICSMDVTIEPDGWQIDPGAEKAHGISESYASKVGIPEHLAFLLFWEMWRGCKTVAHNHGFDYKLLAIASARFGDEQSIADWKAHEDIFCTMEAADKIMQLPPTPRQKKAGYTSKNPTLSEAYKEFTEKTLINAHSAMADTQACMEIYWEIQDYGK